MKSETAKLKECEDYPMYSGSKTTVEDMNRFELQMQEEFLADESYVVEIGDSPEEEVQKILSTFYCTNVERLAS
jgi:hypothetical protein